MCGQADETGLTRATCTWCGLPMNGVGCVGAAAVVDGVRYYRWTFGPPSEGSVFDGRARDGATRCHDCEAPVGGLHHPGCDLERCPRCLGQRISCGCAWEGEEPWEGINGPQPESRYARRAP